MTGSEPNRARILHKAYRAVQMVCESWTTKDQAAAQAQLIVLALAENGLLRNAKIERGMVLEADES